MRTAAAVVSAVVLLAACTSSAQHTPPRTTTTSTSAQSSTSPAPVSSPKAASPYADWPTYHGDVARSGVALTMPTARGAPRVARSVQLDAAVYASPIVIGGTVVVATENNSVYALSTAGDVIWQRNLGAPAHRSDLPCGNIDPSGITGTPVYAPETGMIYTVAEHASPVRQEIVGIDLHTGQLRFRRDIVVPDTSADAMQERAALTVAAHRVWVAFGGRFGDCGNYKGSVLGVPVRGTGTILRYTVPTTREAGIWAPPGPSIDSAGRLYVAVGNGSAGPYDHSDSVLQLDTNANVISSFSPRSWSIDNRNDLDLGSQGPALVGDYVFQAGKSGTAYVVSRQSLGGIGGELDSVDLPCHSYGGAAVRNGVVYVPCTEGVRAVRVESTGHITPLWKADSSVTGSPVLGGGRVWALDTGSGALHELDPNSGASVGSVSVGQVTRFATPAIYGPDLFIGTQTGLTIVATS